MRASGDQSDQKPRIQGGQRPETRTETEGGSEKASVSRRSQRGRAKTREPEEEQLQTKVKYDDYQRREQALRQNEKEGEVGGEMRVGGRELGGPWLTPTRIYTRARATQSLAWP